MTYKITHMKRNTSNIRLMELAGLREVDDIAGTYGKLNYGDFEFVKVTQQVWDKMTELQQANAVLSAIDDTDEAEGYIGAAWDELPSVATANMRIAIKKGTSMNEVDASPRTLAASELLSLMAAPEFKKYKDQLGDFIEDADFAKIDKLYTALYAELKKHE